ncbi:MAG: hypothetical protein AAF404_19250 [Pseudomonadota bacterium]
MESSGATDPSYQPIKLSDVLSGEELRDLSACNNWVSMGYLLWHLGLLVLTGYAAALFYKAEYVFPAFVVYRI